jgi:hypothetical protein
MAGAPGDLTAAWHHLRGQALFIAGAWSAAGGWAASPSDG